MNSTARMTLMLLIIGTLLPWQDLAALNTDVPVPNTDASAPSAAPPVRVTQRQFQFPVLKNQPYNPVLLIRVAVEGKDPLELTGMTLNTRGTTDLKDLKAIRVYYHGQDASAEGLPDEHADLFGTATGRIGKRTSIAGRQTLEKGTHFFRVSLELERAAGLDHLLSILCRRLTINGESLPVSQPDDPVRQRIGVAVRQPGQDNVHTSRIPGLATTNKGTLLAIFDARYESSRDLQGHIDIGLHRSTDGGDTWEPIQIVLDMKEWGGLPEKFNGVSDACILVDKNSDAIYIAGLWMHGVINSDGVWVEGLDENSDEWNHQWRNKGSQPGFGVKQSSQFMIVKSTDDGKTWSKPVNVTRMCKEENWWLWAPAPGRGITLEDGTLVFPTQGRDESGKAFSNITYSKDGGKTWITSHPATAESTSECAVVQLSDGSLMLNMRSGKNKGNTGNDNGRAVAVTRDLGKSWEEHPTSFNALPEPTCMASLYKHTYVRDGQERSVLVFSNPNSRLHRENITLKISFDNGNTWPEENQVLLDEGRGRGYSCLTSIDDDHIGVLYESSRADLVFQKISLNALLK